MNICMPPSCENKRDISLNMNTHSFRCPKKVLSAAIVFALHRSDLYVFFPFLVMWLRRYGAATPSIPGWRLQKKIPNLLLNNSIDDGLLEKLHM